MLQNNAKLFITFFLFINLSFAHVPFTNVELLPGQILINGYDFFEGNVVHGIIFCYDNTLQNNGEIIWTLGAATRFDHLPIYLKIKSKFQGKFADPSGTITIINTEDKKLIVSCQFAF